MKKNNRLALLFISSQAILTLSANSPYISKVYEFTPAPGQFVNSVPEISPDDTKETILKKVADEIGKSPSESGMISLGAFGGYVIFGFDHPVVNVAGEYDFKIYGNAVLSDKDRRGGSSEPGIVLVSSDINKNGIPDDPWYELAGSEYFKPTTLKNNTVTYYRPSSNHTATPDKDNPNIVDTQYIRWTDSDNNEGYLSKNTYHTQSYWPEWIKEDKLEFFGTRLPSNAIDTSGNGSYYVLLTLDWGYADNWPNSDESYKGFDISWAVDSEGNKKNLSSIDFIKVHTGILGCYGWIGENSTEISSAEDLHPDAKEDNSFTKTITNDLNSDSGKIYDIFGREISNPLKGQIYIMDGKKYVKIN